jgi:hypothetical protein
VVVLVVVVVEWGKARRKMGDDALLALCAQQAQRLGRPNRRPLQFPSPRWLFLEAVEGFGNGPPAVRVGDRVVGGERASCSPHDGAAV